MMRRATGVAFTALSALACLTFVAPAGAHEKSWKTTVDLAYEMRSPEGNAFTGAVKGRKRCVRGRKVTFIRAGGGSVGKVRSSRSGRFDDPVDGVEDGNYFAKAKKEVLRRSDGHLHKCRRSRSPLIAIAGSCDNLVLSGGPNATDNLSVDDDLRVDFKGAPVLADDDDFANDHPPEALGATTGGEDLRVIASNSSAFAGPMSLDPLWIHCTSRSVSFALDPAGFSAGDGGFGETFYDESFEIPDVVP